MIQQVPNIYNNRCFLYLIDIIIATKKKKGSNDDVVVVVVVVSVVPPDADTHTPRGIAERERV